MSLSTWSYLFNSYADHIERSSDERAVTDERAEGSAKGNAAAPQDYVWTLISRLSDAEDAAARSRPAHQRLWARCRRVARAVQHRGHPAVAGGR